MAWETPKTWLSEPLTSVDLNEQVRDNLNYLKDVQDNSDAYSADEIVDYTTSSGSFIDVDADNFSFDITPVGSDVLVGFMGTLHGSDGSVHAYLDIAIDDVLQNGDDGLVVEDTADQNGYSRSVVSFVYLIEGLTPDQQVTISLQWKTYGGTATLYAGAGTTRGDVHPQFWVREV